MEFKLNELCLEVSNICPMSCKHCSSQSVSIGSNKSLVIPEHAAKKIISDFATGGGAVLEISGGEPLIYPYLHSIVRHAYSAGLEVRLYTSGVVADTKPGFGVFTPFEAQRLKALGLNKIIFNLEGFSANVHQRVMGTFGTQHITIQGIKNALSAGIWTGVHIVPMKLNFQEIPDLIAMCGQLGVDEVALLRFVSQGRGRLNADKLFLSAKETHHVLKKATLALNASAKTSIRIGCPFDFTNFDVHTPKNCKAGKSTCVITPTGDVAPCPAFKHAQELTAGNVFQKDLTEIWKRGFN